jgi:hypothetical protein
MPAADARLNKFMAHLSATTEFADVIRRLPT